MFCAFIGLLLLSFSFFLQTPHETGWRDPFPGVQRPQTVPYRAGKNVGYPKLIRRVAPATPLADGNPGTMGAVTLELIINEKGEVWQARVLGGPPSLIDAALEAVRHWHYEPTIFDGRPSPVVTVARVGFFPQNKEARQCGADPPGSDPIRVGSNVQQSKLLRKIEPSFPPAFRGRGTIMVQITVNEKGDVYEAWLLRGPSSLEKAVLAAICQWQYFPTYLNGRPVPVVAVVAIEYNLPAFP